jgi:hypothetical protein
MTRVVPNDLQRRRFVLLAAIERVRRMRVPQSVRAGLEHQSRISVAKLDSFVPHEAAREGAMLNH